MEYSIDFSDRLIDAANSFVKKPNAGDEAGRAVLYLSLLACEISLKFILECAGFTPKELTKRSHDLHGLLTDICKCEIADPTIGDFVSAAKLLSVSPNPEAHDATVGQILDAESEGASKYPNEIRYGDLVRHFDAIHVLECAKSLSGWAKANIGSIRKR